MNKGKSFGNKQIKLIQDKQILQHSSLKNVCQCGSCMGKNYDHHDHGEFYLWYSNWSIGIIAIPELYDELWFNLISALKYALAQKYNWPSLYCSPQPNKNKST